MENPTIVVITDRNDLDDQPFGTFARCHELLRQQPVQAESREHLQKLLQKALPLGELRARLGSSPDGLSQAEATSQLAEHGYNEITEKQMSRATAESPSASMNSLHGGTHPTVTGPFRA